MGKQTTRYKTQWAAQFFAAAELTRRGYLVSLTFGNAPASGLHVQSPIGTQFTVETTAAMLEGQGLLPPPPPQLGDATLTELLRDGAVDVTIDPKYPQAAINYLKL